MSNEYQAAERRHLDSIIQSDRESRWRDSKCRRSAAVLGVDLFPTAHAVGYVDSATPRLLSETKASPEVLGFEIRHFFENLISPKPRCEEIDDVTDANAHPPNAWSAATLF